MKQRPHPFEVYREHEVAGLRLMRSTRRILVADMRIVTPPLVSLPFESYALIIRPQCITNGRA